MKDPAFLFYYRDFKSSTEGMSNAARGAYIQLMCLQAENGFITEVDMKKICSNICFNTLQITIDENTLSVIKTKFKETAPGSGQFINGRLEEEITKRLKYSESRRSNRKNKKEETYVQTYDNTYEESYEKHMVNGNRNINENINENIEKGVQGEKVQTPCLASPSRNEDFKSSNPSDFFTVDEIDKETEELFMRNYLPIERRQELFRKFIDARETNGDLLNYNQMRAAWRRYVTFTADGERKKSPTKTNKEILAERMKAASIQ